MGIWTRYIIEKRMTCAIAKLCSPFGMERFAVARDKRLIVMLAEKPTEVVAYRQVLKDSKIVTRRCFILIS